MLDDKLQEECGVLGFWNNDDYIVSELLYIGLFGIQHRGQQSVGMAISDMGKIIYYKEIGLITEVFNEVIISHLGKGSAGIAHVGYNTQKENIKENSQPLVSRYSKGQMAISYNGCLLNSEELTIEIENSGIMLQTTSDAEIIGVLLSRERIKHHSIEDALVEVLKKIKGSFSFLIMTPNKLIAVRDGHGMKPLCMGKIKNSYIFSSESSSIDSMGGKFVRDVVPGEIIIITKDGINSKFTTKSDTTAMCIFEVVYLARTDSRIDGVNVYDARFEAGKILAHEFPVDADIVVGVPDSGIAAAHGYALESGIPFAEGLIKNRYIGRTFIQPTQAIREQAVSLKLNVIRSQVEGKKIVLIDDSIVRGTTSKKIVQMLKEVGGAKEVHMRISSPPVTFPCIYGIDTPDKEYLIANQMSLEKIATLIGADSLGFISLDGLLKTPKNAKCSFCYACFNGNYPIEK